MTALLTTADRLTQTDALLARLHDQKQAHLPEPGQNPSDYRRELLQDPEISSLVNEVIQTNMGWIRHCIGRHATLLHLRENVDELLSKAVTGGYAHSREVGGVFSAVLSFNYGREGAGKFPTYVERVIAAELLSTGKEKLQYRHVEMKMRSLTPKAGFDSDRVELVNRRQEDPSAGAMRAETLAAVKDAVRFLPKERRAVAEFMIDQMLQTGELPLWQDIATRFGISSERGREVGGEVLLRLRRAIDENYPQLARSVSRLEGFGDERRGR